MVTVQTRGVSHQAVHFLQDAQLKDHTLWEKFVDVYRSQPDTKNFTWRGEFWGKMMRGATLVYQYSKDDELYDILTKSVCDMLTVAESDGRVSTYIREEEFSGWDLWCRKYVILGCEYYLDICKDENLRSQILSFISNCADYIIDHIGDKEGQTEITDATNAWLGLNSSSILEPIVRLYRLTLQKKYLNFATYIIKQGGAKGINVFKLAYENRIYPYQYGVSKAYEMMSCFEGLLEYYCATGIEDCKTAVVNFANAIMETELSIIGCSGITHELFDYTSARQTVRPETVLQETCVTVTWMKLCSKLLALTNDTKYADCMEHSFYNAYLGTLNTNRKISPFIRQRYNEKRGADNIADTFLPVDSYSPLLSGKRGRAVGGHLFFPDNSYYGCCASIAAAGIGVFINNMIAVDHNGISIHFFEEGSAIVEYGGAAVTITQKTAYPADGRIEITIQSDIPKEFTLKVRVPGWTGCAEGYVVYQKEWSNDTILLNYPMPIRTQAPKIWKEEVIYIPSKTTVFHDPDDDHYIALMRGPLTLAADSRMGKPAGSVFDFEPIGEVCSDKEIIEDEPCLLKLRFTDKQGSIFYLVDYASAGKDWNTEIAAWLKVK